jgi:hypothetical protein
MKLGNIFWSLVPVTACSFTKETFKFSPANSKTQVEKTSNTNSIKTSTMTPEI